MPFGRYFDVEKTPDCSSGVTLNNHLELWLSYYMF